MVEEMARAIDQRAGDLRSSDARIFAQACAAVAAKRIEELEAVEQQLAWRPRDCR
jgi:hypothetical protein